MRINWQAFPTATHYHKDSDCFYLMEDGEWQLVFEEGDHCKSDSLYNGETDPKTLIAKEKK